MFAFGQSQPWRCGTVLAMAHHEQPVLYSGDLIGCSAMCAVPPSIVAARFVSALESAGATVVQALSHNFPGAGLTCVLILAESHAVLHTWPETGTVNIDIFSCSTRLKSLEAIAELGRSLGADAVSIREMPRADGHAPPQD
jgi:S-adenosylmethionine decarboxylase proenzyme